MVKQATKGQKEIYDENQKTIIQYLGASAISSAINFLSCLILWECSTTSYTFFTITAIVQVLSVLFMRSLAGARLDEKGHVLDAGADLNDPEAFGEYCKDAIILTTIIQILALITSYAYWLLIAFPLAIGYKFIVGLVIPWFTSGPEEPEMDEKKQRKMERKREKVVYRR